METKHTIAIVEVVAILAITTLDLALILIEHINGVFTTSTIGAIVFIATHRIFRLRGAPPLFSIGKSKQEPKRPPL